MMFDSFSQVKSPSKLAVVRSTPQILGFFFFLFTSPKYFLEELSFRNNTLFYLLPSTYYNLSIYILKWYLQQSPCDLNFLIFDHYIYIRPRIGHCPWYMGALVRYWSLPIWLLTRALTRFSYSSTLPQYNLLERTLLGTWPTASKADEDRRMDSIHQLNEFNPNETIKIYILVKLYKVAFEIYKEVSNKKVP